MKKKKKKIKEEKIKDKRHENMVIKGNDKTKIYNIMMARKEKGRNHKKWREQSSCERSIQHRGLDPRPIARAPWILSIM